MSQKWLRKDYFTLKRAHLIMQVRKCGKISLTMQNQIFGH